MEPQTPQPQTLGTSQTTQVDPTALALSRAIRSVEGGDYTNTTGDAGTSKGAYQWQPGHFEAAAKSFGLDPTDFSPTNQDHVAYEQIKQQLDAGHSQSQVASWWNSGRYDSTGNVGDKTINGKVIHFDTPSYVAKVQKAYEANVQSSGSGLPNASSNTTGTEQNLPGIPSLPSAAQTPVTATDMASAPDQSQGGGLMSNILGGAKAVGQAILNPAVSLGTHLGQAAAGATADIASSTGLFGGQAEADKINARYNALGPSQDTALGGKVSTLQPGLTGAEQLGGDVAQNAAYLLPGEGLAGAAGAGALLGAGGAASQGADLPTVATSGLLGTALGAGTAGLANLAGTGIQKAAGYVGADAEKAMQGIKNAYSSALNLNVGERAYENRSGNDLAQVLMDNKAPLGKYENSTLDASKAVPILQQKLDPLNAEANVILGNSNKTVNLLDAGNTAKTSIAERATTASDRKEAAAGIDSYIQDEIQERTTKLAQQTYGQPFGALTRQQQAKIAYDAANPTVQEADRIKQGFWAKTFDKNRSDLQNHIPYQVGSSLKDAIEAAVPEDAQLKTVNAQRGDLIDAIRRLQKMDGVKLIKGGRLGKMASGAIGSLVGVASGTGPLGVLAGDYIGKEAGDFLQNPATKIGIAQGKASIKGLVPRLLGKRAESVGKTVSKTGETIKGLSRPAGLVTSNLLTRSR